MNFDFTIVDLHPYHAGVQVRFSNEHLALSDNEWDDGSIMLNVEPAPTPIDMFVGGQYVLLPKGDIDQLNWRIGCLEDQVYDLVITIEAIGDSLENPHGY